MLEPASPLVEEGCGASAGMQTGAVFCSMHEKGLYYSLVTNGKYIPNMVCFAYFKAPFVSS